MNNKTRVVIADDQNISRGFFEMYVRAAVGYELVAGLRTAGEAVEFLDENEADLLILDVMMQEGIDGITAAQQIKEKHPSLNLQVLIFVKAKISDHEKLHLENV